MPSTVLTSPPNAAEIQRIADDIINGTELVGTEARRLLDIEPGTPAYASLMVAADRVRKHFHGVDVHFCSIVNTKAGNCSENCSYCSQAGGSDNDAYDKHGWLEAHAIEEAANSAKSNGAEALGLVAAWKGIKEGSQLDMVCDSIEKLTKTGVIRPDVNLGILENQHCADRIAEAGAKVYGHNLETARSFFDQTCTTHDFDERWQTIQYIKKAGMGLCSGGIIGMGESKDHRIEFAEQLRFISPNMIPINFLNPLEGTGFEDRQPMNPDEAMVTLAVFRLMLPENNIMVAGGKEITFGDRLHEVLKAGVNAVMVGNYLTTLGTSPTYWHDQVEEQGLRIAESDAQAGGCGAKGCGC